MSACLLGENCKYDGGNNYSEKLAVYLNQHDVRVVPVCPEVLGGLSAPRKPSEIVDGTVRTSDGESVDAEFRLGARRALEIVQDASPSVVVLQSRSPSCGVNQVYDGTFSSALVPGRGVFASMMVDAGYSVVDIEDL